MEHMSKWPTCGGGLHLIVPHFKAKTLFYTVDYSNKPEKNDKYKI